VELPANLPLHRQCWFENVSSREATAALPAGRNSINRTEEFNLLPASVVVNLDIFRFQSAYRMALLIVGHQAHIHQPRSHLQRIAGRLAQAQRWQPGPPGCCSACPLVVPIADFRFFRQLEAQLLLQEPQPQPLPQPLASKPRYSPLQQRRYPPRPRHRSPSLWASRRSRPTPGFELVETARSATPAAGLPTGSALRTQPKCVPPSRTGDTAQRQHHSENVFVGPR
jgi:hypothetical protein